MNCPFIQYLKNCDDCAPDCKDPSECMAERAELGNPLEGHIKKVPTKTFTLFEYDVLGNEDDGFTVNNRREVCKIHVEIPVTPFEINRALHDASIWQGATVSNLIDAEINADDEPIELTYEITGQPVGQLVPEVES